MRVDGLCKIGKEPEFEFFLCSVRSARFEFNFFFVQRKIGKEQENELYELIGQQDKRLAAAYVQYKDTGRVCVPNVSLMCFLCLTRRRTCPIQGHWTDI